MRSIVQILSSARQLTPLYIAVVVGAVLTSATTLAGPFIISAATDEVIAVTTGSGGTLARVMWLAVALLAVEVSNTAISNLAGYYGDVVSARLRAVLSNRYFAKLLRLPQRYYDDQLTGTIIGRLNRSIAVVTDFLNMFANSFFPLLLTLVAVLAITGWYSPWLSLLLVVIYPTFVWLTALTSKRWQEWEQDKNQELDAAAGRFSEAIAQIRVVKSFVAERRELAGFSERYRSTIAITKAQSRFWHRMDIFRRAALDLVFFAIFAIIFVSAATSAFSIGVMVLLIQLVNMARAPVTSMSYFVDTTQRAIAGSKDYFAVMAELDEPDAVLSETETGEEPSSERPLAMPLVPVEGEPLIEFDRVTFGYGDADVVTGVCLAVKPGEKVAFVGESGGGKTTLVNLLLRLYPLGSGAIRLGGHDIAEMSLASLRRQIGVVFQDPSLFSGTVRENIAYGRPEATQEEVMEAARRANAHSFISSLPGGYDAEIGERGIKLSGGQKQRIAVARAMLADAPILVLDEATSALDSKSERAVQAGLEELMANRTTLIIAHRLSTISSVDRIVTLRDGRVDEIGTPEELARSGGVYAELLALQAADSKAARAKLRAWDILR